MSKKPHISVCICTYKRPHLLRRLLDGLAQQQTDDRFAYSIVVADNDVRESGRKVVDEFAACSMIKVTYCIQPEQNISLTRNKALDNAGGDFIAFIDDDEYPIPEWLLTLFKACVKYSVDGVLGPVRPDYEVPPPQWVVKGRFYDRASYPTGYQIDWKKGRTGNVLLKRRVFDGLDKPFRPEFLTGEDQDFFRRAISKGYVFVWCNEAVAYEVVPSSRWRYSFIIRRALLRGKISIRHPGQKGFGLIKSLVALPLYGISLPFLLLFGYHHFIKYLVKMCDHAGRIMAIAGVNVIEDNYVTD